MEGSDENAEGNGGGSAAAGARWNPTKEQISILERMYADGIRTPSADQIQEIAGRLREYGHIEGKNVFYWFQNHKARQRQKEKQERLASYLANATAPNNVTFYHQAPPPTFRPHQVPPIPPPLIPGVNVICNPYCMAQCEPNFFQHQQINRAGVTPTDERIMMSPRPTANYFGDHPATIWGMRGGLINCDHYNQSEMKTLDLFPMHPTGILVSNKNGSRSSSYSATTSCDTNEGVDHGYGRVGDNAISFF